MNDEFDALFDADSTEEELETNTEVETEEVEEEVEETTEEETEANEAEAAEVETAATPAPEEKGANFVPLAALLDEREKAKASKAEIDRLNQRLAEIEEAHANTAVPDPYDNLEAYHSYMAAQVDQRVRQQMEDYRIEQSMARVQAEHGEDFVNDLKVWTETAIASEPMLAQQALSAPDPVQFVIDLKKRRESLAAYEADPEAFIREEAIRRGLIPTAETVVETIKPSPKKAAAPKSIASASSRGAPKLGGFADDFEDIFK